MSFTNAVTAITLTYDVEQGKVIDIASTKFCDFADEALLVTGSFAQIADAPGAALANWNITPVPLNSAAGELFYAVVGLVAPAPTQDYTFIVEIIPIVADEVLLTPIPVTVTVNVLAPQYNSWGAPTATIDSWSLSE